MTRVIYNPATQGFRAYPRSDDEPVVGLDPDLIILDRIIEPKPEPKPGFSVRMLLPVVNLAEKTVTYGWTQEPIPVEPPEPEWIAFGAALGADPQVNQFFGGIIQTAPVLHMMIGGGLLQAAQGDPRTFLTAWEIGRNNGLVSPQLASYVQDLARPFNLPPDFITALNP